MLPSSQLIGPVFSVHKRVHDSVAAGLDCRFVDGFLPLECTNFPG